MDREALLDLLKRKSEMDPDKHDGCYELVCKTVEAYKDVPLKNLDFKDLDCIYLMVVGTWRHSVSKKKRSNKKNTSAG